MRAYRIMDALPGLITSSVFPLLLIYAHQNGKLRFLTAPIKMRFLAVSANSRLEYLRLSGLQREIQIAKALGTLPRSSPVHNVASVRREGLASLRDRDPRATAKGRLTPARGGAPRHRS